MSNMVVSERFCRQGLASKLLRELMRVANEAGAWEMCFTVPKENEGAMKFYLDVSLLPYMLGLKYVI